MVKLKYADGETPIVNEHSGTTFQPNNYGQSAFPGQKNDRKRYEHQWLRQQNNQKAVRRWRDMSVDVKNAWNNFATTYPQPSKRDPNRFLSGYELFVRRNSYCFLNHGINEDFMEFPVMEDLPADDIIFTIASGSNQIDVTELYIKNFGLLPEVGDYLLLHAIFYGEYNGQFFTPITRTLQVQVVFIDGLFVSLEIPDQFRDICISVYLSKPVHAGVSYAGTKCRYMGCFTPKTFEVLQDVFVTYVNHAGDIIIINEAEDGLSQISVEEFWNILLTKQIGNIIYDENTEWSHTDNITVIDYEDPDKPFNQSLAALISDLTTDSSIVFEYTEAIAVDLYRSILIYVNLQDIMSATQEIQIRFRLNDVPVSDFVSLAIDKNSSGSFQELLTLLSAFTFSDVSFNQVELAFVDSAGASAFPELYFDFFCLLFTEVAPDSDFFDKFVIGFEYDAVNSKYILHRNGNLPDLEVPAASGGSAPDTITSTTTNQESGGLHTHALDSIITPKTTTLSTVTVDAKGRVTALASGSPQWITYTKLAGTITTGTASPLQCYLGLTANNRYLLRLCWTAYDNSGTWIDSGQVLCAIGPTANDQIFTREILASTTGFFTAYFSVLSGNVTAWIAWTCPSWNGKILICIERCF